MTTPVVELLRELEERGIQAVLDERDGGVTLTGAFRELDAFEVERLRARKAEIRRYLEQARIVHPARWSATTTAYDSEVLTDWSELVRRPRPNPETLDAGAIAAWIERSVLPPAPFEVRPGETVLDVEAYARALLRDLRREPGLREPAPSATLAQGRAFLRQIFWEANAC